MSLLGVLGVIFVVLKLVGVITWSWWLVLLPFYFTLAVGLVVLVLWATIGVAFVAAFNKHFFK